ncbi:hypothetical protein FIBSPDRAFT_854679 [Athelia psychrophila]|uniref:VLRF1 domain-containing protein n=1 Tax=Athelia psychrophila TaxID=1759441 RepID=A0A166Q0Q6_9AGAM|nr:hypothetical protein FIBSPDRAFT_854679 [Fibularhizoctonia sp. CBS 109695]
MAYHSYNVYSLPKDLLDTLTPRSLISHQPPLPPPQTHSQKPPQVQSHANGARACTVCPAATFLDVEEQRAHFRSDWHRYNVKLRLTSPNAVAVSEDEFSKLVDALEVSISGSASSSEDEGGDDSDEDAVAALMKKTALGRVAEEDDDDEGTRMPQTALSWFHSPPSTQIGIYKTLFPLPFLAPHFALSPDAPTRFLEELKRMQEPIEGGRTWALFMVAGGHFAGAVVRVSKDGEDEDEGTGKKKKQKKPKPDTEVILHKTFHRYTTRRKQGGSQGLNDNAKGNAKSAGAQLRRYGELSLQNDIRTLLSTWAEDLDGCERIFIRASGGNRRIFLGDYEGSVLEKGDDRLRGFPFPTRRPTQDELLRCLGELARVKTGNLTEEALKAQDEAFLAALPKPKPKPTPAPPPVAVQKVEEPKLSKEEEALRERWGRLLEMVTKGRLEPLRAFWAREQAQFPPGGVDAPIPDWAPESHRASTLLQAAALAGHEDVTSWLLDELNADPTIPVPLPTSKAVPAPVPEEKEEDGEDESNALPLAPNARRTAYDLAHTRAVRNVFRRAAYDRPTQWDWLGAGRVPSALSREMEARAEDKKKGRRKGLKDRVREREARDKEKDKEREPVVVVEAPKKVGRDIDDRGPRRLGGSSGAQDGTVGLTPEMRAKVERERRARAAEARIKALSGR